MKIKHLLVALLLSSLIIVSCKKDNSDPSNPAEDKIYFIGYTEETGHSFKIEYNADKSVKSLIYADDDSKIVLQPVYVNNKLSELKKSEEDGPFVSILSYEMDDKGRVNKRTYLSNPSHPYTTYEYDDSNNHLIKNEEFSVSGNTSTSQGSVIYFYDKDNITKVEKYSNSYKNTITYTFDTKLNPFFSVRDLFFIGDIDYTALSKNNVLSSSDKATADQMNFFETNLIYIYNDQGYPTKMTGNIIDTNSGVITTNNYAYTLNYIK